MKTDADIRNDVMAELQWDPAVTHTSLQIQVDDGVVVVAGTLSSHAQLHAVKKAIGRIAGIKGLVLETTVELPADHRRSDLEIAKAVAHALAWSAVVPRDRVRPTVEQGWLTLYGDVSWDFERLAAERAVRDIVGVVGISNRIGVTPRVMATEVEQHIFDALARQARREGRRIEILIDGPTVTLRGCVHSMADRAAAQAAAWASPGVKQVINTLTVQPTLVEMS